MHIFNAARMDSRHARRGFDATLFRHPGFRRLSRIGAISLQLATLALMLGAPGANAFEFDRPMDRGGRIGDYLGRIVSESGRRHVIAGDCMSACTMWLGHKGTCVTPDAVLWFHSATDSLQHMRNENPWQSMSPSGNRALLAMYPPRVRAVVASWLQTPDYHTLTGHELASLGVPLCKPRDLAGG